MMAPPCVVWCVGGVGGVDGVGGVGGLVCWWCVAWGVAPCGLVCLGVGVLVYMYVCVAWGLMPHGGLVCW